MKGKLIKTESVSVSGVRYGLQLRVHDHGASYTNRYSYSATLDALEIDEHGTDLSECVKRATAQLRLKCAIVWRPMLAVFVEAGDECNYCSSGETLSQERLAVRVSSVEAGTHQDGTEVWRTPLSDMQSRYVTHKGQPHGCAAMLPDTESNRARLLVITNGLAKLASNLEALLAQDKIVKTLTNLRVLALPDPTPAPTSSRPRVKRKS